MQIQNTALLTAAAVVVGMAVWLLPRAEDPPAPPDDASTAAAPMQPAKITATERTAVIEPAADAELEDDDGPTTTVSIRLFDRHNGAPVASTVELWRLDMPANHRWTAGDQLLRDVSVGKPGAALDLPTGRYRPAIACQPVTSEDPPAFTVDAEPLHFEWPVDLPRTIEVWLLAFDEHGRPIERGRIGKSFEMLTAAPPGWAQPRRDKNAVAPASHGGAGNTGSHPRTADPNRGFRMGRWRERRRGHLRAHKKWLRPRDHSSVSIDLSNYVAADGTAGDAEPRTYVGVSVPSAYFDDSVLIPDGRSARAAGARYSITSVAQERAPDAVPDLWRWLPITVTVRLKGYRDMRFEHRLVDGHPPIHVMAPK